MKEGHFFTMHPTSGTGKKGEEEQNIRHRENEPEEASLFVIVLSVSHVLVTGIEIQNQPIIIEGHLRIDTHFADSSI